MNLVLKLEGLAFLILGTFLFQQTSQPWWLFAALFFAPDLSMIGYAFNNKVGAALYNLFHHYGVAVASFLASFYFEWSLGQSLAYILVAHIGFDRLLGYGLKYTKGFHYTHLGTIGKKA